MNKIEQNWSEKVSGECAEPVSRRRTRRKKISSVSWIDTPAMFAQAKIINSIWIQQQRDAPEIKSKTKIEKVKELVFSLHCIFICCAEWCMFARRRRRRRRRMFAFRHAVFEVESSAPSHLFFRF